jgi:para-nitrobenzyl esterase
MSRWKASGKAAVVGVILAIRIACVAAEPAVRVWQGRLTGSTSAGTDAFLGIPYGAPPTGESRWRAPRAAPPWSGSREAKSFGPDCQQEIGEGFGPYTSEYLAHGPVSEDCLSLNVWRPSGVVAAADRKLPVLVWVHGGAFSGGSGAVPIYNGAAMAREGVVVVTVNYRLGVFGFLAHPDLSTHDGAPGNYGIQDLLLALHWIKDNVAAFGGDPSRVTLAGQSAGSMAIHDLMVSPDARGLFQQVISESGPGLGYSPKALATAEATGSRLMAAAGAHSIDELRRLPAERIARAVGSLGDGLFAFAPVVDGRLIPSDPYASARGGFIDTPVLAGMTADEASSPSRDERRLQRGRGLAANHRWADARVRAGKQPVYLYLYEHTEPGSEAWGAFHTSEVPYALRNLDAAKTRTFTRRDRSIADQVSGYWLNFMRTGDPNGPGRPRWPRFDVANPRIMRLGDVVGSERFQSTELPAVNISTSP